MKGIKLDFDWNGKYFGHKEFKRSNGRINKFYVASNSDFDDAMEISSNEHLEFAEKYAKAFGLF